MSLDEAHDYTRQLSIPAEVICDPRRSGPPLTADAKDDYLVALARVAAVDVLVSGDHHLTDLPGGQVVVNTPSELLAKLERI